MTEKKDPNAKMVNLLKTINLINKLILELHDIPILEKLNAKIEETLKGDEQMKKTCDNCIHYRDDETKGALCYQKNLQKVDPESSCPLWEDNKGITHKIVYKKEWTFEPKTVFDKITQSYETLADAFVYGQFYPQGMRYISILLYTSNKYQGEHTFNTREEAIAATIEELKREVEPNND